MVIDLDTHRDPEGFPVDHPLDALKKDHDKHIRGMHEGDQKRDAFLQLGNAIIAHMDVEEKELFQEVMLANLDLSELGADMQAFEVSIVAAEAPTLHKPERRT
ncbi:MAG TPA: hypothetical protein VIF82_15780 [Burkholderiaceae bacterium]